MASVLYSHVESVMSHVYLYIDACADAGDYQSKSWFCTSTRSSNVQPEQASQLYRWLQASCRPPIPELEKDVRDKYSTRAATAAEQYFSVLHLTTYFRVPRSKYSPQNPTFCTSLLPISTCCGEHGSYK